MQGISQENTARIKKLNEPESIWQKLTNSAKEKTRLLEEIGNSGELSAIPGILEFVLVNDRKVAVAAAQAVILLLAEVSQEDLVWLDGQMRIRYIVTYGKWGGLEPAQLRVIQGLHTASAPLLGVASFHANGYIREKAIDLLAEMHNGDELSYLLIRANDWVPQVRAKAQYAIKMRIVSDYVGYFVRNIHLVERLSRSSSAGTDELTDMIFRLMMEPAARELLHAGFTSLDKYVRRMSYRLALIAPEEDVLLVLNMALHNHDSFIRSWGAKEAANILEEDELKGILPVILRDTYMPVRRTALMIIVEHFPEDAHDALIAALLDINATIRELARYHLRRIAPMDFAEFYREALNGKAGKELLGVICSVGETGIAADAERLLPFALQGVPRQRKVAIDAIARLAGDDYIQLFIDALVGSQVVLSNAGRVALKSRVHLVDTAMLTVLLRTSPYWHVRKNALLLLISSGKWSSLLHIIYALGDGDEHVDSLAKRAFQRWMWVSNRYFVAPTAEQQVQIRAALDADKITDIVRQDILFMLDH